MSTRTVVFPLARPTSFSWVRARLVYLVAVFSLTGVVVIAGLMIAGIYIPTELLIGALAIFFGIQMKVADLLVDHGLTWFRGADKVFGIGWGLTGSLLMLTHQPLANFLVPMILAFLGRKLIDRQNHGLACVVMLLTTMMADQLIWAVRNYYTSLVHHSSMGNPTYLTINLELNVAGAFLVVLLLLGWAEDSLEERLPKPWRGILYEIVELRYWALPFAYSVISEDWLIFACSALFIKSYELTRLTQSGPLRRGWEEKPEVAKATFGLYLIVALTVVGWLVMKGLAGYATETIYPVTVLRNGAYQVLKAERAPGKEDEIIYTVRSGFWGNPSQSFIATRAFKVAVPRWDSDLEGYPYHVGVGIFSAWQQWRWDNPAMADSPEFSRPPGEWLEVRTYPCAFMGWGQGIVVMYYAFDPNDPFHERWPYTDKK